MKYLLTAAAVILSAAILPAADMHAQKESAVYRKISAAQAKSMMETGKPIILDVRTQSEYDSGHIPGAILIPNESIGSKRPAQLPDLNAQIVVYCRSGRRSAEAARKLVKLGYTNVYDFGGIIDWPYATVKGE